MIFIIKYKGIGVTHDSQKRSQTGTHTYKRQNMMKHDSTKRCRIIIIIIYRNDFPLYKSIQTQILSMSIEEYVLVWPIPSLEGIAEPSQYQSLCLENLSYHITVATLYMRANYALVAIITPTHIGSELERARISFIAGPPQRVVFSEERRVAAV
jgi:hypothetical protein